MTNLLTPDTFEFFARYLLAGYVVIFVRSAFVVGLRPKPAELLMEAVILSLVAQFLVVGIEVGHDSVVSRKWSTDKLPEWLLVPPENLKLIVRVLLVPAALGCTLGLFLQSNWRNGVLRRFSLPVVHPVRKAHDYAFGHERPPGLVEITFEDGTKIGGWFGENSLAATDETRSDLYLERAYLINDDGDWQETVTPRAILIKLRNVRSIEFLLSEDSIDDDETANAG
ncbi:DUF6338 family protein [Marinovum sp. 2_MG-2023]|uniref:DUF6338 family protein n=1 Tax=unclassified Marinovum TaxID=2647166 RepID=UPI0026E2C30B|nr:MULTISPECIES: DUF6338 family protein [unclassified Marinovum]MDO6730748.1 DUF6338 family protein [Marinovum sp. 2_MG-2023]MDO6780047.1 DUF6338 family protein [Marinovum sp. 1_MG-2023]